MDRLSKILLTHSYFYKLDPKQWRFKQPYPPLGTLWAASVLKNEKFEIDFQDACLKEGPQEIVQTIQDSNPDVVIIYDDGFNYLTKMCLSVMRESAFSIIRAAKAQQSIVVICSSDSTDHCKMYLDEGASFVVRGEGEETLRQLMIAIMDHADLSNIAGITYRNGVDIISNPSRPVINDLDNLPMPAWELVDIESYRKIWETHHGYFSLNVATTRGCPFKCNWCAKPIYGNRYNSRSPENVIREIEYLLEQFKPDHFWMCDDIFGLKPGWVQRFDDLVQQKNLSFKYKIQSRVDLLLEADTVRSLASSGVDTVWVGAESGSQKILDAMDKGTTVNQIREATTLLKEHGIKVGFFLQFGYLGEQMEDIEKTIQMTLELLPDEIGISVSYPLPGTKFYETVKSDLTSKQNWTDSDDLDMMFVGEFDAPFYKQLHRYVHSEYRKHRGYRHLKGMLRNPFKIRSHELRSALATFYYIPDSFIQLKRLNKSYSIEV